MTIRWTNGQMDKWTPIDRINEIIDVCAIDK